jgi:outer membrane receptor protein involved in Fe transport
MLGASAVSVLMGMSGFAQGQALEEIIVTAQKRLETTQETPVSITALGAGTIEKRGIVNSEDLIGEIPGVGGFSAPGSRGATGLSMRGVSAGSPANISLDPAVGMYMDGVYMGKLVGSSMDVAEIERIEVLRGPQGTLYGRNSTAGAVNIITKKPTGEFGFKATATAGNYGLWGLKANVDTPSIGETGEGLGKLSANIGYQTRNRDGLYDNYSGGDDFDSIDRDAWRVSLRWNPSDSVVVDYIYDYSELDEVGSLQKTTGFTPMSSLGGDRISFLQNTVLPTATALQALDPRIAARWIPSINETIDAYQQVQQRGQGRPDGGWADFTPTAENETEGHSLTVEWEAGEMGIFGDVTFKSITAYRELETYVFGDIEDIDSSLDGNGIGAYSDVLHATLLGAYTGTLPNIPPAAFPAIINNLWADIDSIGAYHSKQDTRSEYEQFSQELQMTGSTDQLDYTIGLYWFEDEGNYDRKAIFSAPLIGEPRQQYTGETEAFAVFGQGTYRFPIMEERLSLTAGVRYTEETKEMEWVYLNQSTPFTKAFGIPESTSQTDDEENFYNFSYTATIAYELTEDINVFLRNATGYRSGGFNGEQFGNAFDEETIDQWELGFKSDWWDNRLRINGSLYTYEYEDMQVSQIDTSGGGASTFIVNAGAAERWGGELEVMVAPIEDMVLGLTYSYINGDFEEFPATCADSSVPSTCINTDDEAKRGASPSNQVGFTADYTFARTSIGNFNAYLQVNWQDAWNETSLWTGVTSTGAVIYPHAVMDERTVVNARINLQDIPMPEGVLSVSLWGNNLTDDDYPTFGTNFGGLGLTAEQYGEPRTYGLDVTYQY